VLSPYDAQNVPLVVMLHGCTQSPEDFAIGTRMNKAAEAHNVMVAYPGRTSSANLQKCWNWYHAGNQKRGAREPAPIADMTRQVMEAYVIDSRFVFIAGM